MEDFMMIAQIRLPALAIFSACLLGLLGCNTSAHFTSTPYLDSDFDLPPHEISRLFFDVERYSQVTFPFLTFMEMPPLKELKYGCYYGPPQKDRLSWWNLCPFFLVPPICPCRAMVWERGNYRFSVVVAYPALFLFKAHVWYWDVEEIVPQSSKINVLAMEG
jgi:hypothetical protein